MVSYRGFYEWWSEWRQRPAFATQAAHDTAHIRDVLDATEGDIYAVKELLGHPSTRVTEVYLHSSRIRTASCEEALTECRRSNRPTDEDENYLQRTRFKAPSGLEPLYEALQASA